MDRAARARAAAANPRARARLAPRSALGSDYKRAKHARRQRAILDAAAATFRDKGFQAATMQDVAERLGMRPASLYHYLPSKEVALEAICRATGAEFTARLAALARARASAAELLRRGVELHLQPDTLDYVNAFAFHRRELPAASRNRLNAMARRYLASWTAIVRRGIRDRSLRRDLDPQAAAVGVVALCNGAIGWFAYRHPDETAVMTHSLVRLLLDGLASRR